MDGNRRWASARGLPKAAGHTVGARKVRAIVQTCAQRGVRNLTLFAFSTENWRRPMEEVGTLMGLLKLYLQKEIGELRAQGVRLRVIGDTSKFDAVNRRSTRCCLHSELDRATTVPIVRHNWDCEASDPLTRCRRRLR